MQKLAEICIKRPVFATMLVMAPVIIVFFFAQKAFIEGVTLTGVKG